MVELQPARGTRASLPHGSLPEIKNPYLQKLIESTGGDLGPIGLQYTAQPELEAKNFRLETKDALIEDENEVAPGVVYKYRERTHEGNKYPGRALWTITRDCVAYCRFCTRGREVGIPADKEGPGTGALSKTHVLSKDQVDKALKYIENQPDLNEIILSGGDPLKTGPQFLTYVLGGLRELQDKGKLKFVRIGTRAPMQKPDFIQEYHYTAIAQLKIPRMMIHINHPAELTSEALHVLRRFRRDCDANVYSQTVLLKGVNDNVETLYQLFTKIAENGIQPYYLFQCDPDYWNSHLSVPIRDAIALTQKLRPLLSGIVDTANPVLDTPGGYGKVVIPKGGSFEINWDAGFIDFLGNKFDLDAYDRK